jgi:ATP-dependent Clp protease ATP-binding subunit ClpA
MSMFDRLRPEARRAVELAEEHAQVLGHSWIGTEHILLGLVAEGEGKAAHVLRSLGLTEEILRSELEAELGPPPEELGWIDSQALASIGIDLDEVRRRIEEEFGPGALQRSRPGCGPTGRGMSLTRRAKRVFRLALRERERLGDGSVGTEHLLLGLIAEREGLAMRILECRAVTGQQIRHRLLPELSGPLAS